MLLRIMPQLVMLGMTLVLMLQGMLFVEIHVLLVMRLVQLRGYAPSTTYSNNSSPGYAVPTVVYYSTGAYGAGNK